MKIYRTREGFRFFLMFGRNLEQKKIWISRNFKAGEELNFPVKGKIIKSKKGSLVLVPSKQTLDLSRVIEICLK